MKCITRISKILIISQKIANYLETIINLPIRQKCIMAKATSREEMGSQWRSQKLIERLVDAWLNTLDQAKIVIKAKNTKET